MNFVGKAKPLDDIDLPRIGSQIGVGEDVLHMVLDVESRGNGFDKAGRPTMLFEPHIFYRELSGEQRDKAVKQGLAYKSWKSGSYPRDSYPRLQKAILINKSAALKSCSWGAFQVMGFNYKLAGYSTVGAMVNAMLADVENHLQAAVNFIVSAGLDDELQVLDALDRLATPEDTIPFVMGYNGKGFRKNNYHVKAAKSLNKWRGIKDTPYKPVEIYPVSAPDAPEPSLPIDLPDDMRAVREAISKPKTIVGKKTLTGAGILGVIVALIGGLAKLFGG